MARVAVYPISGFSDPVSSLTHLAGAGVFACLTPLLLWRGRGDAGRLAFLGVFAFSTVLLLSMSGVYHLLTVGGMARAVMLRLDHGAIFVLIAGTFTAVHGILFRGAMRWGILLFVWAAAIAGITFGTIYFTDMTGWLGLSFYLALGWIGLFTGVAASHRYGFAFIRPLALGGIAYTVGGLLDILHWPMVIPRVVGPHELFHIAVLIGISLHWKFVAQFASGELPPLKAGGIRAIEKAVMGK